MISFKSTIPLLLLCFIFKSYSQNSSSEIIYQRNEDNSITFSYNSDTYGSYLIALKFNRLTNTTERIVKKTVTGYGGEICTLRPIDPTQSIGFSFNYRKIPGNLEAKPNLNFKYILPFKKGRKIKVKYLSYLGKKFGNTEPKNWKAFQFLANINDTVFAIRKGIVTKVVDGVKADENKKYRYKSKTNYIKIEHDDGTFARYSVLKQNSIRVKEGDIVYPSAPIAIAGSYDTEENSQLRLLISYLDKKVLKYDFFSKDKNQTLKNKKHYNSYLNPFFYINENQSIQLKSNNSYIANYNNTIIEYEMSKREKKRWKKKGMLIK